MPISEIHSSSSSTTQKKGHRVASSGEKGCLKFRDPSGAPPPIPHVWSWSPQGDFCSPKGLPWMVMWASAASSMELYALLLAHVLLAVLQ